MSFAEFRILMVKTSSLGDVIHNLPVIADIKAHHPHAQIDWLVEEAYVDLLRLHGQLDRVLGVAQRRWRIEPTHVARAQRQAFLAALREQPYDLVIDFQGLLKSATLAWRARLTARGARAGFSFRSAREPLARLFYQRGYDADRQLHAIERLRALAGAALGYHPTGLPRFGLSAPAADFAWLPRGPYAVFLHATARPEKRWPRAAFIELAQGLMGELTVVLPHGATLEQQAAEQMAEQLPGAVVAPRLRLSAVAALLAQARLVVGVDTGLTHLAAALGTPTVGIFGATPIWRYAPYWDQRVISLGDGRQPSIAEVLAASQRLLGAQALHV